MQLYTYEWRTTFNGGLLLGTPVSGHNVTDLLTDEDAIGECPSGRVASTQVASGAYALFRPPLVTSPAVYHLWLITLGQ